MFKRQSNGTSVRRALPLAAALLCAAGQAFATDIPRGGAVIEVDSGSRQAVIELKNVTGEDAEDVTVALVDGGGVLIKCVDIQETTHDHVDDNGNGRIDAGENDTCMEEPSTVVKSILTGSSGKNEKIANDEEREVTIEFDGPLPEGAKLRVKLSKEIDNTHFDMIAIAPLDPSDPEGSRAAVTVGAAQVATGVVNVGTRPLDGVAFSIEPYFDPYMPPYVSVDRPASVWRDGEMVRIEFETPAAAGDQVELGLHFPLPVLTPEQEFDLIFTGVDTPRCAADCDGSGELDIFDFLCFQNLFAAGDPLADCDGNGALDIFDFLCFQNEFAAGCAPADCLPDVRTMIDGALADPPEVQARYDSINRSLHLYGHLTLEEALATPVDGLLPALLSRLDTMERCTGLPTDVRAIEGALFALADAAGGLPLGKALAQPPGSSVDLAAAMQQLRDVGIQIPELAGDPGEAEFRAEALGFLLDVAGGSVLIGDILFKVHEDFSPDVAEALSVGRSSGLLDVAGLDNDRCCSKKTGPVETDECKTRKSSWCNLPAPSRAYCSIASNACP